MTVLAQALKHFSFSIERMKTYKMHQNARIKSAVHWNCPLPKAQRLFSGPFSVRQGQTLPIAFGRTRCAMLRSIDSICNPIPSAKMCQPNTRNNKKHQHHHQHHQQSKEIKELQRVQALRFWRWRSCCAAADGAATAETWAAAAGGCAAGTGAAGACAGAACET